MQELRNIENKINIWELPPGYSKESKVDYLNVDFDGNKFDCMLNYTKKMVNTSFEDISKVGDTFTYLHEIKGKWECETFEDIPYLIPYKVENSEIAVIVLSGGGFIYKTIDGDASGGKSIADRLNKNGISAYLLHYRSNPYNFPIPMLDIQRAIRYLRYHNKDNKYYRNDKIYAMGFSAGAYVVSSFVNQYMNKDLLSSEFIDYKKDEIDKVDDSISKAAFIYPQLTFNYHLPMLSSVLNDDKIDTEEKRAKLLEKFHLADNLSNEDVWQFVAYGNSDIVIPQESVEEYIKKLKQKGGNISQIFLPGEGHGFSDDLYIDEFVKWLEF